MVKRIMIQIKSITNIKTINELSDLFKILFSMVYCNRQLRSISSNYINRAF